MSMKTLLGIDVGTTSLKVIVLDSDGDILYEAKSKYRMIENSEIKSQIDSENLWKSLITCIKSISKKNISLLKSIAGIGISSLCPGLVGFDIKGNVIVDPIIYSDRRSIKEAEYIYEVIGKEKLFEITGNGSMSGSFSGSSILWIKNNDIDTYNSVYKFGHLNTLLGYKMTGEFGIDYSNASYTNMLEINGSKKWSNYICSKLEIDQDKLPKLMESSDILGLINSSVAAAIDEFCGSGIAIVISSDILFPDFSSSLSLFTSFEPQEANRNTNITANNFLNLIFIFFLTVN